MPVSAPSNSTSSSPTPSASGVSTARKYTTLLGDHSYNYTHTYGYNFGYIANGLALIEEKQHLASLPAIASKASPTASISTVTASSTISKDSAPSTASTKVSLTFPPTPGTSTTAPLLEAASSIHPFSPHYNAYIELVTSGGFSKKSLEDQHRVTEKSKSKRAKTTTVPGNVSTTGANRPSPPPSQHPINAVRVASSPKRKLHFEEPDDDVPDIEVGMGDEPMDYFSLPKSKSKKARITRDEQMRDEVPVSSTPLDDPPSSSSGSASEIFSSMLGLSTTGTWATTPSLIHTPGSAGTSGGLGGSGHVSRTSEDGRHLTGNRPGIASKSFAKRSPSPTESMNSFGSMAGGMITLDLLDRPRSPGVFTQPVQGRKGKDEIYSVKEPRPKGLWRARGSGPRQNLPSILNMNAGDKGKAKGTSTDIHDRRTAQLKTQSSTPTPTGTSFLTSTSSAGAASTFTSLGSGIESAGRRESRLGETGYCSSSCSSYSSDDMSDVAKSLKRRRMKRTASGKAVEGENGYVDDGSLSSADSSSSTSTLSETQQKRPRRRAAGAADGDHPRRHQDDQRQRQQHDQSRKTLLSPSTTSSRNMAMTTAQASTSALASNDAVPQNEDLADATKYFTRSKIMDTTSLARTRFSDKYTSTSSRVPPPPAPEVTYGDWEDLKEVWARCLEVIDTEEPEEILPLLRAIIHECGRIMEAYEDPSVLILAPPPPPAAPLKVDSGVGTSSITPPVMTVPPPPSHRSTVPPPFVHPKDLPTAFHTLLGTALFFFGNIIGEAPHLALEGEPASKVFYHLYAVDVFEMGENLPARTGIGLQREASSGGLGSNRNLQPRHCQDDCCTPGSKEDWRLSATWGRALVSLADELLEREQICDQWLAENPQPSAVMEEKVDGYFSLGRPTYFGNGGAGPSVPFRPNPASFLSEDFISAGGVVREGYFGGTGGTAMGLKVDGMGGLTVSHPGGAASGYCSPHGGIQLPSSLYPLSSFNFGQKDGDKTPISPQRLVPADRDPASPGVLSPFGTLAIGEGSTSPSNTPRSVTFTSNSGPRSSTGTLSTPNLSPSIPLEDPRRHWQKDSPFVVIWNRLPPVTRRMVLGGTQVNGTNPLPSPALPTPPEPSTFTLSWWNTDDSHLQQENNGRYPSSSAWDDDMRGPESPVKKPKVKKNPGTSVDEMMGLAVDHLSRGLFHMPRTGQPRGLGGVGSVEHSNGRPSRSHSKSTGSRVHHHHHRHHRHSRREEGEGHIAGGAIQPFSRASHLLTIAMEVLMLAEKLPSAQSRYRWASHADSIFEQMRLEESPGIIKPSRREEGMDVDIDLATGHISSDPEVKKRMTQRKPLSRTRQENLLDAPLYSYSQTGVHSGAGPLDSNRSEVILKARGRCSLIVGSAIAEDRIESYLEELDEEQASAAGATTPTPENAKKRRQEVVKLLKGEDAEEARAKLRESIDFLERARALWAEGLSARRKERERTKQRIEKDRKARRATQDRPRLKSPTRITSPAPRRRGIGALAAENKKKRKERKAVKDAGMVVEDDAMSVDVDVEMGDVAAVVASSPVSPPASAQNFEEEDSRELELFAAEEQEEEQEEKEYARLLAEALVTLANILLVVEEGDEEFVSATSSEYDEVGSEKEREELYAKAKEEMLKAGVEEIDAMI